MPDRIGVIIDKNHVFLFPEGLFEVSEILDNVSIYFSAAVPVKPLFDDSHWVKLIQNLISVFLFSGSINIHCKDLFCRD